jgi:hypothetical protein
MNIPDINELKKWWDPIPYPAQGGDNAMNKIAGVLMALEQRIKELEEKNNELD